MKFWSATDLRRVLITLTLVLLLISIAVGIFVLFGTNPFRNNWPPLIKNLRWEPTKVVNGKVYNGIVSFIVEDPELSQVQLVFAPKNYTHLPREAFPEESSKIFFLRPVDGAFDEEVEEFQANITNIKGGREYEIKAIAKDAAGNIASADFTVSYIREFENIAPLDNVLIGAFYYPYFRSLSEVSSPDWSGFTHWNWGYEGTPMLGEYSSRDSIVINRHIDELTGYGIDFVLFSWWGPCTEGHHDAYIDRNIKDYFLKSSLLPDIKFAILYESFGRLTATELQDGGITINMNTNFNSKRLVDDFIYLSKTYFSNPQYLKLNNASVVFLYISKFYSGNIKEVFELVRSKVKDNGHNLFLIGDEVDFRDPVLIPSINDRLRLYDAISCYIIYVPIQKILGDFENSVNETFGKWYNVSRKAGVPFIPCVLPGFDNRKSYEGMQGETSPFPVLEKSVERFRSLIKIAKNHMTSNLLLICSFNSWEENTQVENSKEFEHELEEVINEEFG